MRQRFGSAFLAGLLLLAAGPPASTEDAAHDPVTVEKTKDQLHFKLPPDWPIEKRAGMVQPIPVEEYLAMKFKALEAKLQAIEQRLSGLDLRLRVLEEGIPKRSQGLKSSEAAPSNP